MLESSDIDTHDCSECSHRTASVFQLKHHIQRKHRNVYAAELFHAIVEPEQVRCICCEFKSYYQFELYEHFKQAHNPRTENNDNIVFCEEFDRYPCSQCKYKSNSSLCRIKHVIICGKRPLSVTEDSTKATEGPKLPDVNQSGQAKLKLDLNGCMVKPQVKHVTDQEINWFRCNHCSYRAKHKPNVKRHILLQHAADQEIHWFKCKNCSYQSKLKHHLKSHMLLQHATNQEIDWFQCNHCSYRAKRKPSVNRHILLQHATDQEIKWFKCNHCSHRSKRKEDFKKHMFQHATEQEINWFKCNHCLHRTKRKGNLKSHMLQHATDEEINWFKCNNCSYRTKHKSTLKQHMMFQHPTNQEINWFQCDHCSYRTKQKTNLKRHMMRYHA